MRNLEERRRSRGRETCRDHGPSGDDGPVGSAERGSPGYRVKVVYTEPEFQERNPHCPSEFSFSHRFPGAASPQEAVKQAMDYFDFCAEHSRVGWRRILKSVSVERD